MKKFYVTYDGAWGLATVPARNVKEAIRKYREAHDLVGKRLNVRAWQVESDAIKASGGFYSANFGW